MFHGKLIRCPIISSVLIVILLGDVCPQRLLFSIFNVEHFSLGDCGCGTIFITTQNRLQMCHQHHSINVGDTILHIIHDFAFHHLKVGLPEFQVCVIPESIFIKQYLSETEEMACEVMELPILL